MKRAIDIVGATAALVLLAPVLAVVAILVRVKLGSPILFRQHRPGLNGVAFELIKFRTMTDERDAAGQLLPNESRMTPFGQWLRNTSMDELPELWNVMRGEMSLVGPRPLLMEYIPLYNSHQARRHEVRPGITGWAQVNGRNAISWDAKFEFDVWYVDNHSIKLDLTILVTTLAKVLTRDNTESPEGRLVTKFRGSDGTHEPTNR